MSKNRPGLVVRNVLVSNEFEILLGLRSDALLWECPGGKVEDETVAEAAIREQEEETGIQLLGPHVVLGYADVRSLKHPERRCVDLFLLWTEWSGFARLAEDCHLSWRWFSVDELPPLERLMPSTRHFVENLLPHYLQVRGVPATDTVGPEEECDDVFSPGPVS